MSERFGGPNSPHSSGVSSDNARPGPNRNRAAARRRRGFRSAGLNSGGLKTSLLFILPLPLLWRAFDQGAVHLAMVLSAMGVFLAAAFLTRQGVLAHAAFDARKSAKPPAFPRKIAGAVLMSLAVALAALTGGTALPEAGLFGLIAGVLHLLSFGIDPLKAKNAEYVDSFQHVRVTRAVAEAESYLNAMSAAIDPLRDRGLSDRVEGFQNEARDMFSTLELDPRDLSAARKYLTVYLTGARDAAHKYARLVTNEPHPTARNEFIALLDDLADNFANQTRAFLANDHEELDIEISVLRDRLAREGIDPDAPKGPIP